MILYPSLANAGPLHYDREPATLDNLDFGSLRLDIEGSSFIDDITFETKTVQVVARQTPHPLSLHFMVAWPQCWFGTLVEIGSARILIRTEMLDYPSETSTEIRHIDARVGLISNPAALTDAW